MEPKGWLEPWGLSPGATRAPRTLPVSGSPSKQPAFPHYGLSPEPGGESHTPWWPDPGKPSAHSPGRSRDRLSFGHRPAPAQPRERGSHTSTTQNTASRSWAATHTRERVTRGPERDIHPKGQWGRPARPCHVGTGFRGERVVTSPRAAGQRTTFFKRNLRVYIC